MGNAHTIVRLTLKKNDRNTQKRDRCNPDDQSVDLSTACQKQSLQFYCRAGGIRKEVKCIISYGKHMIIKFVHRKFQYNIILFSKKKSIF